MAKARITCIFCQAVISADQNLNKYKKHLEISHDIFYQQDMALTLAFLTDEENQNIVEKLMIRVDYFIAEETMGTFDNIFKESDPKDSFEEVREDVQTIEEENIASIQHILQGDLSDTDDTPGTTWCDGVEGPRIGGEGNSRDPPVDMINSEVTDTATDTDNEGCTICGLYTSDMMTQQEWNNEDWEQCDHCIKWVHWACCNMGSISNIEDKEFTCPLCQYATTRSPATCPARTRSGGLEEE